MCPYSLTRQSKQMFYTAGCCHCHTFRNKMDVPTPAQVTTTERCTVSVKRLINYTPLTSRWNAIYAPATGPPQVVVLICLTSKHITILASPPTTFVKPFQHLCGPPMCLPQEAPTHSERTPPSPRCRGNPL